MSLGLVFLCHFQRESDYQIIIIQPKKLHSKVDAITHYANDGEIDVAGLEEFVNRIKR
jgi:hypothetical protein